MVRRYSFTSMAALANDCVTSGYHHGTRNPFRLGADNNTQQFFKGSLDEVRIYNRALSAQEIQIDMNSPL